MYMAVLVCIGTGTYYVHGCISMCWHRYVPCTWLYQYVLAQVRIMYMAVLVCVGTGTYYVHGCISMCWHRYVPCTWLY